MAYAKEATLISTNKDCQHTLTSSVWDKKIMDRSPEAASIKFSNNDYEVLLATTVMIRYC